MTHNYKDDLTVVTGAGGFIGGHMIASLRRAGHRKLRAVDIKPYSQWFQYFDDVDDRVLDLRLREDCETAVKGAARVFNLAADMGGMGFIENNKAACMLSVLINTHMLIAARKYGVQRYFYSSSACVYNADKQRDINSPGLKEDDAYPAMAEDGYGWEKLFSERMCRHFREDYGLCTRVARFHNVYGPHGSWEGGREKAPAAICRKVIEAKLSGKHEITIWGDGTRTRSYMFVDNCITGSEMIMNSEIVEPINLGSTEMVSVNELLAVVERIAGVRLKRIYDLNAPQGVVGRNSENTRIRQLLHWEPDIPLAEGLEKTYRWIYDQCVARDIHSAAIAAR
jgi:nucleoside-diphosphate-sugar epimerase